MPTRIATLGRERSVATLARRVYGLDARDPELGRATAALLKANPRLGERGGFRSGAAVVVPRVQGLRLAEDVRTARVDGAAPVDETTLRLQALSSRIEDGFQQAERERAEAREVLGDRQFLLQIRRALPEATPVIEATSRRLDREEEIDNEARERLTRGVSEAIEAISILGDLGRRRTEG